MSVVGTVRVWHPEDGWGVVDAEATPGGCWVHFSQVLVAGYRSLEAGQQVQLEFERVEDQDGYAFRALAAWPVGADPSATVAETDSAAYRSGLLFTRDAEAPPDERP